MSLDRRLTPCEEARVVALQNLTDVYGKAQALDYLIDFHNKFVASNGYALDAVRVGVPLETYQMQELDALNKYVANKLNEAKTR